MQPRKDAGLVGGEAPRRADRLARRIRAAEAGDQRAVRTLLADVAPTACRVVTYVLGPDHPEAGDLLQDVMVEFLRALPPADEDPDLHDLAACIALRRALEAAQWPALSQALAAQAPRRLIDRLFGVSPQELLRQRRRRLIATALIALSDDEAEVLGLRLLVGLTLSQIAEVTGLPAIQVRSRLRSAKGVLGSAAALSMGTSPLHPEALRDLQRAGLATGPERDRLAEHEGECVACAIERDVAADMSRRRSSLEGIRLGRAIDAATAHWVWNVSRRVLSSRRQRRWTWAALGALITLGALLASALWSRDYLPAADASSPVDLAEPAAI